MTDVAVGVDVGGTKALALVVARDGIPLDPVSPVYITTIPLAPASRVEFIAPAPAATVKVAYIATLVEDTGPGGEYDLPRKLAAISVGTGGPSAFTPPVLSPINPVAAPAEMDTLQDIDAIKARAPAATRTLAFSEQVEDPINPNSPTIFFVTFDGAVPMAFDPLAPPAVTSVQGTVEDWLIENQAMEEHVFHIHQIHFLVLEVNGVPVTRDEQVLLDTIRLGYWDGLSGTFPSVKVRLIFRGDIVGEFVYHCHILEHEDHGMMAIINVVDSMPLLTRTTIHTTKKAKTTRHVYTKHETTPKKKKIAHTTTRHQSTTAKKFKYNPS